MCLHLQPLTPLVIVASTSTTSTSSTMASSTLSLDDLPNELLLYIFSFITNTKDIGAISTLNQRTHELVRSPCLWQQLCRAKYNCQAHLLTASDQSAIDWQQHFQLVHETAVAHSSLTRRYPGGETAMMIEIQHWREERVLAMIDHGVPIDTSNNNGWTPLHMSIKYGLRDCTSRLLNRGIDGMALTAMSETPLHFASSSGDDSCIIALKQRIPDLNVDSRDRIGATPLHWAALSLNQRTIQTLIRSGANVNAVDSLGFTPLMHAVSVCRSVEAVRLLLRFGADASLTNTAGQNALALLQECSKHKEPRVVRLITKCLMSATPPCALPAPMPAVPAVVGRAARHHTTAGGTNCCVM
jgi:hypothetical protein